LAAFAGACQIATHTANNIEGTASLFKEGGTRHHNACLVERVMLDAEHHMESYLDERKLVIDFADLESL
jgi:DNA-binding IscR family transcriptional regulator